MGSLNVFDPPLVRERVRRACARRMRAESAAGQKKDSNKWITDMGMTDNDAASANKKDWSGCRVDHNYTKLSERSAGSTNHQLFFMAEIVEYCDIVHRAVSKSGNASAAKGLPADFPLFGPIFIPPSPAYDLLRGNRIRSPSAYQVEPVIVMIDAFFPEMGFSTCSSCKGIAGQDTGVTNIGWTWRSSTVYGSQHNYKVLIRHWRCTPCNKKEWCGTDKAQNESIPLWKSGDILPIMCEQVVLARDAYDLLVETRFKSIHRANTADF